MELNLKFIRRMYMFKNVEKISKLMDQLIKLTDELENVERKNEMVNVIHQLAEVQKNLLGDLTKKETAN